ncbi:PIR-like protein [Plasmodium gallinaceum]|uniref:PIR-like protein n=1 Tax=Plasmodium gallinaceum TaxID=5849 RepID=A0A1J1GRY9_PLAGA|nr:PIR-like protein [Plasmodium gallinaceum]CRG95238.1 PIR-like protein [Plasmodium gallinaceum]
MMTIYIYFLVCIFQYFYSINFEIGKNNLKKELSLRSERILAEEQQIRRIRNVRSTSEIKSSLKSWLDSIQDGLFDELDQLTNNFTVTNVRKFSQWMHNKGGIITRALNLVPDPDTKSFLNDTLTSWRRLTDEVLVNSAIESYVDSILYPANIITNNNGSSSTYALSSIIQSTSTSLPTPTESTNITTLPISTSSPESTVSPTTALPSTIDLSSTISLSPTTSSDSHINSTTPFINNISESSTVLSTNETNTTTALTINSVSVTPVNNSGGITSATCTGLLCGPAFVALPVSVALLGGVFFFVLLYKYTPVGKFLGRDSPKKKKGKKRLNEMPMERINSPKLLKVEKTENVKRSRLHRFLRAFGYDKNFPYIDEDIPSDQVI